MPPRDVRGDLRRCGKKILEFQFSFFILPFKHFYFGIKFRKALPSRTFWDDGNILYQHLKCIQLRN